MDASTAEAVSNYSSRCAGQSFAAIRLASKSKLSPLLLAQLRSTLPGHGQEQLIGTQCEGLQFRWNSGARQVDLSLAPLTMRRRVLGMSVTCRS
jgi:hypothetical protein